MSTGIAALDDKLGGGLIPGTLTVLLGATGIGKTQLSMQFALASAEEEATTGAILDLCSRGDSQSHEEYWLRFGGSPLQSAGPETLAPFAKKPPGEPMPYNRLTVFRELGRRPNRDQLSDEEWDEWKGLLNRHLQGIAAFAYHQMNQGCRRFVIDGFEPSDDPSDSIQFELFDYLYQQVFRKECEWVARDVYREKYLAFSEAIQKQAYDHLEVGCIASCTSHHQMLDDLIATPLKDGDLISNANTLILMGKIRNGNRVDRALYIAKHRGSACSNEILRYEIQDQGIVFLDD